MIDLNHFIIRDGVLRRYIGSDAIVVIPFGVTAIGDYAFIGCNFLQTISIPDSVREIGIGAFQACRSLECVRLPEGLEALQSAAFSGCIKLKHLMLPPEIVSVPAHLCGGCKSMETVSLSPNTLHIEWRAFYGCDALKQVEFPDGLRWVGEEAFANCSSLERLALPDTVTDLHKCAFAGCEKLKKIELSKNLSTVHAEAFAGTDLRQIEIPGSVKNLDFTAFSKCYALEMIICKEEIVNITNYGASDLQITADVPLFFEIPKEPHGPMCRNMLRGYARMREQGKTTPAQENCYLQYIQTHIRHVFFWALTDMPLLELLTKEHLIPVDYAQLQMDRLTREQKSEQAVVLLNYIGQMKSAETKLDIAKKFSLED